jgi:hypothetical protein
MRRATAKVLARCGRGFYHEAQTCEEKRPNVRMVVVHCDLNTLHNRSLSLRTDLLRTLEGDE